MLKIKRAVHILFKCLHFSNSQADTSYGREAVYYVKQPPLNFAQKSFIFNVCLQHFKKSALLEAKCHW